MSYAVSLALQSALYHRLRADAALADLLGDAIFDAVPAGMEPEVYVTLGPETVRDASDKTGHGAEHVLTFSVVSTHAGFATAKAAAGAVCDALVDADLTLSRGRLVSLRFDKASARRSAGNANRQIDLRFRARVEDS